MIDEGYLSILKLRIGLVMPKIAWKDEEVKWLITKLEETVANEKRIWKLSYEQGEEIERLTEEIEWRLSHAGIKRAQEEHNTMMAEKDAEIERLKDKIAGAYGTTQDTDEK